jgi:hypothetical protein
LSWPSLLSLFSLSLVSSPSCCISSFALHYHSFIPLPLPLRGCAHDRLFHNTSTQLADYGYCLTASFPIWYNGTFSLATTLKVEAAGLSKA